MSYIFLHGLGQNPSAWDKTISMIKPTLSAECPQLADFLGDLRTYEDLYDGFKSYCLNFSQPLNLCGLSLGAVLALNYAVDFPNRVNSLVLIAPQYDMSGVKKMLAFQQVIFKLMPKKLFTSMGMSKQDFMSLTASMSTLNFSGGLSRINPPALILCGKKDKANKNAAESLAAKLPNADFKIVENAGHEVNVDNPSALAEILKEFLRK